MNKKTGAIIWNSPSDLSGYSTPYLFRYRGLEVFAAFGKDNVYLAEVANGRVIWTYSWPNRYLVNAADPIVVGNHMLIPAYQDCGMLDISQQQPKLEWTNKVLKTDFNNYILVEGVLYGNNGDTVVNKGSFLAAEFDSGKVLWIEEQGIGCVIKVDEILVTLNSKGVLRTVRADQNGYNPIAAMNLPRNQYHTPPTFYDGALLIRNNIKGALYCIDMTTNQAPIE